jgi:hypothetical protein
MVRVSVRLLSTIPVLSEASAALPSSVEERSRTETNPRRSF